MRLHRFEAVHSLGKGRQRGVVLVVVLWVVALLIIMLAAFTATVKTDRLVTGNVEQEVRGRLAAEAVLHYLAALRGADAPEWSEMPGEVYKLELNDQIVRFRMLPDSSFIPFNTLELPQLEQVLSAMGLENAADVARDIIELREGRAVDEQGELLAPVRIRSIMHLAGVFGLDLDILQSFESLFSFFGEHTRVDQTFSPEGVLMLLGEAFGPEGGEQEVWQQVELYRVQVETNSGVRPRQIETVVVFAPELAGYRMISWNEYNVNFLLEES